MPTIDERVVSIAFENQVFEQRVATTMATLSKLDTALKNVGATTGLDNIETAANKVTLNGPMSALDKLKAKLGLASQGAPEALGGIDQAGNKVTLDGPMSALDKLKAKLGFASQGAAEGMAGIDQAGNKVTLNGPMSALDKLKARLGGASQGAPEALGAIDQAGNKVTLNGPITAVDKLQSRMGQLNAGSTFTDIENASDNVTLSGITRAIENVSGKFSTMQAAASVALGNIATKAALKGGAFVKSFSFDPLKQGFEEYQTNLGAIQTILANTQGQQVTGLGNTNKYLGQLNTYSDKTIYNFGEMARNIGTFTAAGVDLPKATESIKGIANLAALSGSNSQQASTAMYQLSQAIASGKVGLQDWNSVVNAGMGGAVFQKALMRTGENMGTVSKGALQIDKATGKATINGQSFRESIMAKPGEKSWLTSDVLTKTLSQFTGDLSDAQLKAQGFSDSQIKAIQAQAKMAQHAATEVKTLPQVFDVAKETLGSGWSKTFQLIFGDFNQSKQTFTALSNAINGVINKMSNARNKILGEWAKLGGRGELIGGIQQAFADLVLLLKPIKDAFREIFPAATGKDLFNFTKSFHDLMIDLRPAPELMGGIKRIFAGVFAVLHIGWTIVKDLGKVFFDLLGAIGKSSGGFLNFAGGIGDFLVEVDKALTKGDTLKGIFEAIGSVLTVPIRLLGALGGAISGLFGGDTNTKAQGFGDSLKGVDDSLGSLQGVIDTVVGAWHKFMDIVGKIKKALDPWFSQMAQTFSNLGTMIANAFKGLDINTILQGLQTGLLAGILVTLKKAFGGGGGLLDALKKPLEGFNGVLESFTGKMTAMQSKLHAEALLAIAGAVAVLAAGIYILSTIDGAKLSKAMLAVATGLGELMGAMKIMTSGMGKLGILQLPVIAASMIGLAIAVTILAAAMKIFATMSWEEIGKGLVGVAGSIGGVGIAMRLLPGGGPGLIIQAAALNLLATALVILGGAVKIFATMSWGELAKGLLGAIGAIAGIGLAMNAFPSSAVLMGPSLVLIAFALTMLAAAVAAFGKLKLETIFKGLFGIGASLLVIGTAIEAIPPTVALQAAGLIILAAALTGIAGAIAVFGNMKFSTVAKGLIAMGGSLVVLGIGLTAMSGTLAGSVALLAAAAAFAILAPALGLLGSLAWGTILKGLAVMALTLGVLAVVGLVAAPALTALGGSLLVLGAALVLIGAAIFLAATGLSKLSGDAVKGMAALVAAVAVFIAAFPTMVINFVKGILEVLQTVVDLAPKIITALINILGQLLTAITTMAPQVATAIGVLITSILTVLNQNADPIIKAGFQLLVNLLSGIANNIGKVAIKVGEIVTNFLNALANRMPDIITAGANVLIKFLTGVIRNIPRIITTVANMMTTFLNNITNHIPGIVAAGGTLIAKFLGSIAGQIPKIIAKGADIIISFINGIGNAIPRIIDAASNVARKFINALANALVKLVDVGFRAIIRFLNGIAQAIRDNDDALWNAGWNVASAIIEGMTKGLVNLAHHVINAAVNVAKGILSGIKSVIPFASPSPLFIDIGQFMMQGWAIGIDRNASLPITSVTSAANGIVDTVKSSFGTIPNLLNEIVDMDPVISPVLDLSQVERESSKLGGMIKVAPLAPTVSTDQATAISAQRRVVDTATAVPAEASTSFRFEQNNYSPDPLSNIELYRQTNNQLSQLKSLVGIKG